jgi:hypothetical protein
MSKIVQLISSVMQAYNLALPKADGSPGIYQPNNGVTFCNEAVQYVCNLMGYNLLNGMMANQIYDFIADPINKWMSISGEVAQFHANNGAVVLAAQKENVHGHVNIIIPGVLEQSGSWGKLAPICMNVGASVFIGKRASWAFQTEPSFFVLTSTIL